MSGSKKPISKMTQDGRRQEIADIRAAANQGTKRFIIKNCPLFRKLPGNSDK